VRLFQPPAHAGVQKSSQYWMLMQDNFCKRESLRKAESSQSFAELKSSAKSKVSGSAVYLAICSVCWQPAFLKVTVIVSFDPLYVSTNVTCSYSSAPTPENAPV
jgi:hypothetical protein